MSFHSKIGRAGGGRIKRALGVQAALEWAFRVEKALLELPPPSNIEEDGFGFGLEYVLLQRAALGCKVDGGQHKIGGYVHEDAEVIAATVAGIPDSLGGKRMAVRVAELARAGLTPDWMPGALPRCVPVDIKRNRHGDRATSEVVGTERVLIKGKWRSVEVCACPVRFSTDQQQIDGARQAYEDWWQALGWVREGLIIGGMLREVAVTAAMPKVKPWEDRQHRRYRRSADLRRCSTAAPALDDSGHHFGYLIRRQCAESNSCKARVHKRGKPTRQAH